MTKWGVPSANMAIAAAAVGFDASFDLATGLARLDAFLVVCVANGHVI